MLPIIGVGFAIFVPLKAGATLVGAYTALQRIALLQTLESFDVRVAGCSSAADREEIYSSIATIYARRGVDGLDEFNRMVRTTL